MISKFRKELEELLCRYRVDSDVGIPDHVLSSYLCKCLENMRKVQWDMRFYETMGKNIPREVEL